MKWSRGKPKPEYDDEDEENLEQIWMSKP